MTIEEIQTRIDAIATDCTEGLYSTELGEEYLGLIEEYIYREGAAFFQWWENAR